MSSTAVALLMAIFLRRSRTATSSRLILFEADRSEADGSDASTSPALSDVCASLAMLELTS